MGNAWNAYVNYWTRMMDELQRAHLNQDPEPKMYQKIEPVQNEE